MKYEADHQGNVVRVWDDDGKLIYATRANWGLEANRTIGRQTKVPSDYGDDIRRVYGLPKGGGNRIGKRGKGRT